MSELGHLPPMPLEMAPRWVIHITCNLSPKNVVAVATFWGRRCQKSVKNAVGLHKIGTCIYFHSECHQNGVGGSICCQEALKPTPKSHIGTETFALGRSQAPKHCYSSTLRPPGSQFRNLKVPKMSSRWQFFGLVYVKNQSKTLQGCTKLTLAYILIVIVIRSVWAAPFAAKKPSN